MPDQGILPADPAEPTLLDLAGLCLGDLLDREPDTTLDAILHRLFDPRERDLSTVSAFGSAL